MSIVRRAYRKVKDSEKWHTNRLLVVVYPFYRLIDIGLIFGYQKLYLRLKHSRPNNIVRAQRVRFRKRITTLDSNSAIFKLARSADQFGSWRSARRLYGMALAREVKSNKPRLEYINGARFSLSIITRLIDTNRYTQKINEYKKNKKKPRIAIYTAIAGGYDTLKLPETLTSDADYFLFTDKPELDAGIFKIKPLPYYHVDTPRMTRYIKTHPHQLLAGYDIAIWLDANILITGDISPLITDFIKSKKAVGAIQHPLRTTIYEEAEECALRHKEDRRLLQEQVQHYKDLRYNTNELIESNILMFDLKNEKLPSFFSTWWSEIDAYTRRDQMSINYSLDKNGVSWHKIMRRPEDARKHPLFALVPHYIKSRSISQLSQKLGGKLVDPYAGRSFAPTKSKIVLSQKDRTIDVVYCVHDALEDVKICLASVAKHRKNSNLKLIIVDDGSKLPTAEFLQKFQKKYSTWVELNRSEVASGYTKAANRGLKLSKAEFAILLNSDTIVTDGWSEKMAAAVFSTPGAGIVGPLSSAASHQSIPNHIGIAGRQTATNELPKGLSPDAINKHCEKWSIAGFYPQVPLVHGFCFGITREALNKIGYFDEENFPYGYGEENDYCFRATDAGIGLVIATNTYIFHAKSKSYPDERRLELQKLGNEKLRLLRGKERIERSIKSVLANPYLQKFRDNTFALYKNFSR